MATNRQAHDDRNGMDRQVQAIRAISIEQRLQLAQNLCATAREWKASVLRSLHSDWTEEQIKESVRGSFLHVGR